MDRKTDRRGDGYRAPALLWTVLLTGAWPASAPAVEAPADPASEARPVAVARFEGVASPGLRITLKGDKSTGLDLHHRWIQTQGAPATLDRPDDRDPSLVVPEGSQPLGFLLIVGNAQGVASALLTIPIDLAGATPRDPGLRADAGDDLAGFVGRQVTLNGVRSEPRGRIGYRWIQAGGPSVALKLDSGCFYTFVPPAAGNYQFALVVASGDRISEPDYVGVAVAPSPDSSPSPVGPSAPAGLAVRPVAPGPTPVPTDELTRLSARSVDGGPELTADLAVVFADVASRMDVFRSYDEAYSEISRRLDALVPRDPARRAAWTEKLFVPLTLRMIETLRPEGLDLARPEAQSAPLSSEQRSRLADHFRAMARGFGRATVEPDRPDRPDGPPVRGGDRSREEPK